MHSFFSSLVICQVITTKTIEILSKDAVLLHFSLKLHADQRYDAVLFDSGTFCGFYWDCVSDSSRESERINSVFNVSTLHAKQLSLSVKIVSKKCAREVESESGISGF